MKVAYGDEEEEYLITGYTQGANMEGEDAGVFEGLIKDRFDGGIIAIDNIDQRFDDYMGAYTEVISAIGMAILVLTVFVVILILYFVIYASVIRQKQQLGIQKAIGMTTVQLMNQISLSFILPTAIGTVIGGVLGITQCNRLMTMIFKGMGVARMELVVKAGPVVLFGIGLLILAYLIALLVTSQIRKISAYALVKELQK